MVKQYDENKGGLHTQDQGWRRSGLLWEEGWKGSVDTVGKVGDIRREPRSDTVCLEGNGYRPSHKGDGYKIGGVMYTLNSTEVHAVCYGIGSYDSNAMKSSNPHSGIYEAETSRTLDLNGGNPSCNQGGMCIVEIRKDESE